MFSFQSSLFTYEDKGIYDKITTSISEQQIEGNESPTVDVTSQKESGKLGGKEQEEGRPAGEWGTSGGGGDRVTGARGAPAGLLGGSDDPTFQRAGLRGMFLGL